MARPVNARFAPFALTVALVACASPPPPRGGFREPPGWGRDGPPPEHRARAFISPMGEPFRDGPDPAAAWFAGVDTDHDNRLTLAEFRADAMRFFATLDLNHDHEIGPEEIERYEEDIAPEVRSGGGFGGEGARNGDGGGQRGGRSRRGGGGGGGMGMRGGGGRSGGGEDGDPSGQRAGGTESAGEAMPQGAARYGYLAFPEPVAAADADMNRGVSEAEFLQAAGRRFVMLDATRDGVITRDELPKLAAGGGRAGFGHRRGGPPPGDPRREE